MARPRKPGSQATAAATAAARASRQKKRQQAGKGTGNTATTGQPEEPRSASYSGAPSSREDATDDPTAAASSGARTTARAADDPTAAASSSGARTTARAGAPRTGATTTRATRAAAGSSRRSTARHKLVPYIRPSAPDNKNNFQCAGCFQSVHALPRDLHAGGSSECMPCVLCCSAFAPWCRRLNKQ